MMAETPFSFAPPPLLKWRDAVGRASVMPADRKNGSGQLRVPQLVK